MLKNLLVLLLFPLALIGQPTNQFKCECGCIVWGTKKPRSFSTEEALRVHNDWHKGYTCLACGIICRSKEEKLNNHGCSKELQNAR